MDPVLATLLAQTSRVEPTASATLRPEGGVWHVAFNGKSAHVPDMKGLWHLRELVSRPRAPVLALALIAAPNEEPVPVSAAVAHVLQISDGKIVRFDQYVDSATINPLIGA